MFKAKQLYHSEEAPSSHLQKQLFIASEVFKSSSGFKRVLLDPETLPLQSKGWILLPGHK